MSDYDKMHGLTIAYATKSLTVQDQYDLAVKLAANCGYQLVKEDDERSLQVKQVLVRMKANGPAVVDNGDREILMQGLEALLK